MGDMIVENNEAVGGKPTISGTRIEVKTIVQSRKHIPKHAIYEDFFPVLNEEQVEAALDYYEEHTEEIEELIKIDEEVNSLDSKIHDVFECECGTIVHTQPVPSSQNISNHPIKEDGHGIPNGTMKEDHEIICKCSKSFKITGYLSHRTETRKEDNHGIGDVNIAECQNR